MGERLRRLARRLVPGAAGCLLGGALTVPLGPTTTPQAVDRMNERSMRPVPSVGPPPAGREDMIWVPPRRVPVAGDPTGVLVPGHWERRLPGTREVHVPPLVIEPSPGAPAIVPGGVRPPVEERFNSP